MLEKYSNAYLLDDFVYEEELYYKAEVRVTTTPNQLVQDDWEWQYEYLSLLDEDFGIVTRINNPSFTLFTKQQADFVDNRFYNDYIEWENYMHDDNPYEDYHLGDFS